jgi:flagellar biosynthesis protein FliQ
MPLYLQLLHDALATEMAAIAPLILILLIVGFVTAMIQAALQIEDATFALLPKTFAMIALAMSGGFGALNMFEHFATGCITHAPELVRQAWY